MTTTLAVVVVVVMVEVEAAADAYFEAVYNQTWNAIHLSRARIRTLREY